MIMSPKPKIHCSRRSFFTLSTALAAGFTTEKNNNISSNFKQKSKFSNNPNPDIPFPEYKPLNIAKITIGEHLAG